MQNRQMRSSGVLILLVGALGCGGDQQPGGSPSAFTARTVQIMASDSGYVAPDSLEAGWVRFEFENQGAMNHMAQLVRLEDGRSLNEFIEAYLQIATSGGRRPDWAERVGGPGAAGPGGRANAIQYVGPGEYAIVDLLDNRGDRIPNLTRGLARPLVVRGASVNQNADVRPIPDAEIEMLDYAFRVTSPVGRGKQLIRVENAGAEPHEIILAKLLPGRSVADALAWFESPDSPPPFRDAGSGGLGAISTGGEAYFEVDVTTGRYVLLCLVSAPDGQPHIAHGMVHEINVQ